MSLHKFAEQVAAHGRGEDSLLVHMTPDEVRKLQQFAEANGTTLTINPHTGLPEAGLLSDFFKMVAPVALGAFLGPGAFGIAGMGLSAGTAGLLTGGITTLATGSLSRGLMAGLGAYGGAGLAQGFADAGANALGAQGTAGALGVEGAATGAGSQAAMLAEQTAGFGTEGLSRLADSAKVASGASPVMPSSGALMSKGLEAAGASPMQFAKDNWKSLAAAAAPIMAGAMVPTTTKMPENTNPAYIRQKLYDPYTQTYKSLTPVKASEWGSRNFSDAYTNPQTGEMATLDVRKPTPMATGGIVALAAGGIPGYADGMLVGDQDVFNYFKGLDPAKLSSGALDAQIAKDMQTYNVSAADIARITGTQGQQGDYEKRFVQAINKPDISAQEFQAMTSDVGLQNQALANAMQNAGMSQAAQYASTHGLSDVGGIGGTTNGITDPNNFYNKLGYTPGALPGDQGGLEGLYANINYAAKGLQNQIAAGNMTGQQAREAALTEMNRARMSEADLKAATGKTLAELFPDTKTKLPVATGVVPGDTKLDSATSYYNGAFGNYGSGPATGVDYLGRTVSIATPGDIITNPDGTRTVVPNIPGRPYGGFTGMDQVKSAYTAGGGSLGYTARAPRTIDEFNQLYNKQTGDSLAAYDYLMGKGAGTSGVAKYPIQSTAAATGINRPYWGEGMRYKQKFLTANKDGTVTASSTNPNAAGASTPSGTLAAKSIYVTNNRGESEEATLGSDGKYYTSGGDAYDVTGKQLAAGGGLMSLAKGGYADGGQLSPEDLTAQLQAYKQNAPTTAEDFAKQQSLWADYANRYANSSWDYANMGGKAQDYSLKPADYLQKQVTGYAEPINQFMSEAKQNTPTYSLTQENLAAHPEISDIIGQVAQTNPNFAKYTPVNDVTINNLAGDIERFGKDAALRNFLKNQQNLVGLGTDTQAGGSHTMADPTYAAYNDLLNKYTPTVADEDWNKKAVLGVPKGSTTSTPYRDPTTGKGLSLVYQNDNPVGVRFIDQSGIGDVVYNDPAKLIEAAYQSGIPLSAFDALAKQTGTDVLIPSQRGLRDGDYFPEGLKGGVKFNDIASGNLAKTIASDEWLKFMIADAQAKNTNPADYAGGLNSLIAKYRSQNKAAKDYLKKLGYADGGMAGYSVGGGLGSLGSYSDGGRLLKGPGDGVSDSIPATIGANKQPARLADGEFVVPARIVSELGNGSTEAGAKKLYAMMDRVQKARGKTTGKNKVAANTRADKYLPA